MSRPKKQEEKRIKWHRWNFLTDPKTTQRIIDAAEASNEVSLSGWIRKALLKAIEEYEEKK